MDFTLKKIIASLLLPFPIAILCLLIAWVCLWRCRRKTVAIVWLTVGLGLLLLTGSSPIPTMLMNRLERQYTPLTTLPNQVKTIVVLGGGVRNNTDAPPNTQLSAASLARLLEGVRLYKLYQRQGKPVTLILSGGRVFGKPAEAGMMQNIAVVLGVSTQHIKLEDGSRDTAEEAHYLKHELNQQRFILVTSAYHMPRSMMIFKDAGLHPIAAPTQYMAGFDRRTPRYYVPNAKYLVTADIAIHEYLGILWQWLQQYKLI